MGIVDEDVAAVRAASDIVAIVGQHVQLRRVGRRWQGLCPFHNEKTPSFSVNAEENVYYCFGCQASGDVITFVREVEQLDFVGAVEYLAGKAGMSLRYTDRAEGESRKRRARLVETMAAAVDWYHRRLLSAPDAGPARRYLRARGIDGDVVRDFQLGWAPEAWDELCRALGLDARTAEATGLGRLSRGRLRDHFRARILFPINDEAGNPISFGGRILPGGEGPGNQGKYKNTAETALYSKSRVLYGLDRARKAIVSQGTAVICEGYTDVIGFHRSGVPLAVATCGTALTDDHVRLLSRFAARRLVLAFDADAAGQSAAERFYQWEREHDIEVAVADLPPGEDPADTAARDPARLVAAVEGATPFLRFRLERAFGAADLSGPEGRARAAEAALAIVAEHPSELVRDQYLMEVASRCRFDADRLRPQLDRLRSRSRRAARDRGQGGRGRVSSGPRTGSDRGRRPGPGFERRTAAEPGRVAGATAAGGGPATDGTATTPEGAHRRDPSQRPAADVATPGGGQAPPDRDGSPGWLDQRAVPNEPPSDVPPPDATSGGGAVPRDGPDGRRSNSGGGPSPGGGPFTNRGGGGLSAGGGAPARGGPARGRGTPEVREGPALEVLRHAVHNLATVDRWLSEALFDVPLHAEVYRALVTADSTAAAREAASPPAALLLTRLLVEEPASDPVDAVRLLLREVALREMRELRFAGATADDPERILTEQALLARVVDELRDPRSASVAGDRLVAWLGQRVGDGG
ncbi:MAG TPA: DNA primase [Acidimicrobiales bacterium]